jgi:hypothetical protein
MHDRLETLGQAEKHVRKETPADERLSDANMSRGHNEV